MVMSLRKGFTVGADPELFLFDSDGNPVSAHDLLPGTKSCPYPVSKGAIQVDGTAAEFNINPVTNFDDFKTNILTTMQELNDMLPKGIHAVATPVVEFPETVWNDIPFFSKELGCSPDMNAWTGEMNLPPDVSPESRTRCAGGHIHIGWTNGASLSDTQHVSNCRDLVRQFDFFLGGWSVNPDPDPVRRSLYGTAGACRYKPYGVEYRVLSNFWLKSESLMEEVWNRTCSAIDHMSKQFIPSYSSNEVIESLIRSINTAKPDRGLFNSFSFPLRTIEY